MLNVEKNMTATTPRWFGLALQSLMFLAKSEEKCPSGEIAGHVCSEATLMRRILAKLARAKIVQAREGRDGRYILVKPAEAITLADVYRALQMTEPLFAGMLETVTEVQGQQAMRQVFTEIIKESEEQLLAVLEKKTIADLVGKVYGRENCV